MQVKTNLLPIVRFRLSINFPYHLLINTFMLDLKN
nr:MAG TPA: hypothetical protein [Caudoviricetes sp.]